MCIREKDAQIGVALYTLAVGSAEGLFSTERVAIPIAVQSTAGGHAPLPIKASIVINRFRTAPLGFHGKRLPNRGQKRRRDYASAPLLRIFDLGSFK